MKRLFLRVTLLAITWISLAVAAQAAGLHVAQPPSAVATESAQPRAAVPPSGIEATFTITIDAKAQQKWGLQYPATYVFAASDVPGDTAVHRRDGARQPWVALEAKTAADFFNGVQCVRADREKNKLYVSVGFKTSNTIELKFAGPRSVRFESVAKHYDARRAAYTLSNDNWGCNEWAHPGAPWKGVTDDESDNYQAALHVARSFHLPLSIAVNTRSAGGESCFRLMQEELDRGDFSWEPAVHGWTHPKDAAAYAVHGYKQETAGCREDILKRLHNIPYGQYVVEHILTHGYVDDTLLATDSGEFLFLRGFNWLDNPTSNDYVPWNKQYGFYGVGGLNTRGYDALLEKREPKGRYFAADVAHLNQGFDEILQSGGIFYGLWHPDRFRNSVIYDPRPGVDGQTGSTLMQHLAYVANRKDVWYAANGWLYVYRYVAENARVTPAAPAQVGDWPQWRGPLFNGSTNERGLPSQWSTTENIAWVADLPGEAASTPVICGGRVFLSGVDTARDTLLAMCFDRATGKRLWSHDIAKGIRQDQRSTYASASPVTDGRIVVFFYGNGDLVCFDAQGNRRWARNLQEDFGPFAFGWTFSSSPLLYEGKLYLQVLQRDVPVNDRGLKDRENESYLLALEPDSGKTFWRVVRPSQAVMESREAFTTPIPYEFAGRKQLLVAGGDALSAHDPASGKLLWQWGTWNPSRIPHWRLVPSPVAGDGIVLACAPKRDPIYAVKADGSGVLDDRALAWVSREAKELTSDVPTPALYDGDFFVLSDMRKCLSRVEPRSGKVKWTVPTPAKAKYEASPLAADGKIYIINFAGDAAVIDAASGKTLHAVSMDKPVDNEVVRASIVAAAGQLFIRTTRKLYCVGKGAATK